MTGSHSKVVIAERSHSPCLPHWPSDEGTLNLSTILLDRSPFFINRSTGLLRWQRDDRPGAWTTGEAGTLRHYTKLPEPYEHAEAGHFLPKWGNAIAREALAAFN